MTPDEEKVFKTPARRQEFWDKINAVLEEFNAEMTSGLDLFTGDFNLHDEMFNPDDPRYVQGVVLIVAVRNMDGWENLAVMEPIEQSSYMTHGLLSSALESQ